MVKIHPAYSHSLARIFAVRNIGIDEFSREITLNLEICISFLTGFTAPSPAAVKGAKAVFLFGSIVYNRAIVYKHRTFVKPVVHVIIIDQ